VNHNLSSLQQYVNLVDEQVHLDGSQDRLSAMLNEADQRIAHLSTVWSSLLGQLQEVEAAIQASEAHARRLDAFVDDALYSGDAPTARRCAEQAALLRSELTRVMTTFRDSKHFAAEVPDTLDSLRAKIR
jgi:phage shock protein A